MLHQPSRVDDGASQHRPASAFTTSISLLSHMFSVKSCTIDSHRPPLRTGIHDDDVVSAHDHITDKLALVATFGDDDGRARSQLE